MVRRRWLKSLKILLDTKLHFTKQILDAIQVNVKWTNHAGVRGRNIAARENNMKWMLIVYICSAVEGECRNPPEYPAIKNTYYECVQDGLGDAYEILFGSDSIFTPEMILNSQLYPQYKCTPVKDEGKVTT